MDVNDWRSLVTAAGLVLFLVLVAWTWSGKRRSAHEAAARLPFADSEHPRADGGVGREQNESDVNAGGRRE